MMVRSTVQIISICALSAAVLSSCSNASSNGGAAPPPLPDRLAPPSGHAPARQRPVARRPEPTQPDLEERFSFAGALERAHLRSGGLLIDFGTPARHKYTLADWKSGFRGDFGEGDRTYTYVSGSSAQIFFVAFDEEAGGGAIAFRAKGIGTDKARVYLNGDYVGTVALEKTFSHGVVRFDKGIRAGRNEIRIATNGKAKTPEGIRAAMAVDYVRISPEAAGEDGPAASTFDTPRLENVTTNRPDILLTNGETLSYYLPVPAGARLRGRAWRRIPGQPAKVSVFVRGDGGRPPVEAAVEIPEKETVIDIDLSRFAQEAVEVSFRAMAGSLVLHEVGLYAEAAARKGAPGRAAAKNFILVLIDTLRADKLALYNPDTRVRTPYLSRLGAEGVVFERALAPENWTKPSVASLLTGLFPTTHNTKSDSDKLPATARMMSEHLKSLGFETAAFVANGYISGKFGFERGWDTWTNYVREGKPNRAQFVVDDATKWLEQRTDDRPFFLYVHTIDPHVPYIPPQKYLTMYDAGHYKGPVEARTTAKLAEQIKTGRVKLNARDKMRFEALYDGEITYHDDQLVRLQETLARLGLLGDTLIIVTSDHGEEFFDHGSAGHGHSLYEELLHVPLMVRLPGVQPPAKEACRAPGEASLVDVFPTACDILGIECPGDIEGESLLPRVEGRVPPRVPSTAFAEFLENGRAVRMGRYKLLFRGQSTTLFDLETDPKETTDRSDELPLAHAALFDSMGMHLGRFIVSEAAAQGSIGRRHDKETAVIDKETERQLKALGYLGGE